MRSSLPACLAILALCSASAQAQQRPPIAISQVRVGFPAGNLYGDNDGENLPLFKAGAWAPVYVEIKADAPGLKGTEGPIEVVIETPDPDDVSTNYTVIESLPVLGADQKFTVLAYTRLAGVTCSVSASLRWGGKALGEAVKKDYTGMDSSQALYLTIGGRQPGLRDALRGNDKTTAQGRENAAFIDKVSQMPLHWFGYQGADLIILSTGNRDGFLLDFANRDQVRRREALLEWVERGGHLVVSVAKNQKDVAQIAEFQRLLPVKLAGLDEVKDLRLVWPDGEGGLLEPVAGGQGGSIEVVRLEKKTGKDARPFHVLLGKPGEAGEAERPLIVQAPFGLGRVTLVAFDVDQKPFVGWKGQPEFWQTFLGKAWPRDSVVIKEERAGVNPNVVYNEYGQPVELLGQLQTYLENFDDVPVISFGWVALFIIIYILVVGPLDYFFLKKVVKRLELTWITFPTVVLAVSALAYLTAYQLKGNDLRLRKVDVVDIDLRGKQTVGHTWFTLFSPRIQHYTIGIEPAAPDWAPKAAAEPKEPDVTVSWMNRPEQDRRGGPRARNQSLFRRSYDYEPGAVGLKGVPIQVWSTKSFTASWQAPLDASRPLVTTDVRWAANDAGLGGNVTWWPRPAGEPRVELQDTFLIYKNTVYSFPLQPGTPRNVNTVIFQPQGQDLDQWLKPTTDGTSPRGYNRRSWMSTPTALNIDSVMRPALFHQALEAARRNSSLRFLDQTWRVRNEQREELILVARLVPQQGQAEEIIKSAATPSRLWLGGLPGSEAPRPPIAGLLRQETYVRVFIPISQ
jgi:hypothetical protein